VPVEQEVQEELAHHIDLRTAELVAGGMHPEAARIEAERRFGDRARVSRTLRHLGHERDQAMWRRQWLSDLILDVRIAVRHARLNPSFTLGVVLTLAIGLGATTAIFSVVHAVLLAPFPYAEQERVLGVPRGRPSWQHLRRQLPLPATAGDDRGATGGGAVSTSASPATTSRSGSAGCEPRRRG
jgi:hypothetical protein